NGGRAEGVDDPYPRRQLRLSTQSHGQDMTVNGRRVYRAASDQPQSLLMPPRLHDAAEVAVRLTATDQVVTRDAIARLRVRFVVGPRTAAQVGERLQAAGTMHNHVREVDCPAVEAPAAQD